MSGIVAQTIVTKITDNKSAKSTQPTDKGIQFSENPRENVIEKIHKTYSLSCKGALLQKGCSRDDIVRRGCPAGWEKSKLIVETLDGGNGWAKWLDKDNKNDCSVKLHIGTGQYSSRKTVLATVYIKKK